VRLRVSLVAVGRATFDWEAGRSVERRARALLRNLGAEVRGPEGLIESADQVPRGLAPGPDEVGVLLCATFADASVAEAAFAGAVGPVVLWAVRDQAPAGDRLHLNSLCGANLAAHALVDRGVTVRLLYGDPEEPAVREQLPQLAAAPPPAADGLRPAPATYPPAPLAGGVIGLVGTAPTGFSTCRFDAGWLRQRLGLDLRTLPLEEAFRRIRAVPAGAAEAEVAAAAAEAPSLLRLPEPEVARFGATTAGLRAWAAEAGAEALALRCWPEFPTRFGLCPCSALGRLAAAGLATACEADVNGAATMLLLRALGAADVYLADLVRVAEGDVVTFWHCGLAPLSLAANPGQARQDTHCNRGIGVAGNFALRGGRVTVARISRSRGRHRLFLTGGEGMGGPNRFKGNSLDVRLDGDAEAAVRRALEWGLEHHTVLAWGEFRPQVREVGRALGLEVLEV
jgi:L-fucose isomerase-like protein